MTCQTRPRLPYEIVLGSHRSRRLNSHPAQQIQHQRRSDAGLQERPACTRSPAPRFCLALGEYLCPDFVCPSDHLVELVKAEEIYSGVGLQPGGGDVARWQGGLCSAGGGRNRVPELPRRRYVLGPGKIAVWAKKKAAAHIGNASPINNPRY